MMADLAQLLRDEAALVGRFVTVLEKEQALLRTGDIAALPALEEEKSHLVAALNQAGNQRESHLTNAGLTADRAGMERWLATCGKGQEETADAWQNLLKLAARARQTNLLNGQLIGLRLNAANEALAILTNQSRETAMYDRGGQTQSTTGSRIIDAA